MRKVGVIGVPRSGTNLVKYLIESNTDVNCYFHHGWWKHGIIPPLMHQRKMLSDDTPTIVMFREPVRQIAAFYNFARKGRAAMSGADELQAFIASPIKMTPDRNSIEYCFSSPIEYWNQFYHAALSWNVGETFFVALEELQGNPELIASVLSKIFPENQHVIVQPVPEKYLGRNQDRHVSEGWEFENDTTIEREKQEIDRLCNSLTAEEVTSILSERTRNLYEQLIGGRFPNGTHSAKQRQPPTRKAADQPTTNSATAATDPFWRGDFVEQFAVQVPRSLTTVELDETPPLVLVAVLAKQAELTLNLFLECLERQTYPKSRICIYVRTNNSTDRTVEIIRTWADRLTAQYKCIEIDDHDLPNTLEKYGVHEWNSERLQILGEIRNGSLLKALEHCCEYYFTADVDNFITPNTLAELVALRLPIVAPFLRARNANFLGSNFFADVDSRGYFLSTPKYYAILSRLVCGVVEVPLVHCTYLVRSDVIRGLSYTSPGGGYEFINFAASARKNGIPQYVDNRQVYGYTVRVDPADASTHQSLVECRMLIQKAIASD